MEDQDQIIPNIVFKIIIVGDAGVGKSCLLMKFTKNDDILDYNPTIGFEFQSKVIKIDDKLSLKLQIWDTAGQESFRSIVRSFYRNSSAVFLVYSIADRASFENLAVWFQEAKTNSLENSVFVLVGAQKDKTNEREIQYEEGVQFMKENNMELFFETSALDGSNVETSFRESAKLIYQNYSAQQNQLQNERVRQNRNNSMISNASIDDHAYYEGQKKMEFDLQQKKQNEQNKKKCSC